MNRLLEVFRKDSLLQLAGLAFIIVLFGVLEPEPEPELKFQPAPLGHTAPANGHYDFHGLDSGPLIIELPAPPEAAMQTVIARLTGREVHVKDETGTWRILKPPVDQYGRIQDHTDDLVTMAKITCSDKAPPEVKAAFLRLDPEARRIMCEMAAGQS